LGLLRGETLCEVNMSVKRAKVFCRNDMDTHFRRSDYLKPALAAYLILCTLIIRNPFDEIA
jgi:hypothetical protein